MKTILFAALLPLLAQASPRFVTRNNNGETSETKRPEYQPAAKDKTCIVPSGGSNATDDSEGIRQAFLDCQQDATIVFEEGVD